MDWDGRENEGMEWKDVLSARCFNLFVTIVDIAAFLRRVLFILIFVLRFGVHSSEKDKKSAYFATDNSNSKFMKILNFPLKISDVDSNKVAFAINFKCFSKLPTFSHDSSILTRFSLKIVTKPRSPLAAHHLTLLKAFRSFTKL